jgi:hypothetical protein
LIKNCHIGFSLAVKLHNENVKASKREIGLIEETWRTFCVSFDLDLEERILKQLDVLEELSVNEQIALIDEIKAYFAEFPYVSPSDLFQEYLEEDYEDYISNTNKIALDWPADDPIMDRLRALAEYVSSSVTLFGIDSIRDPGTFQEYMPNLGWLDYSSIRLSLAGNSNTPPELLEIITTEEAHDWDDFFPQVLANNPTSTAKVIEELVMESTTERGMDKAAILAIKHPNTGSQLLLQLLDSDFRDWVNADFESEVLPVIVEHHNLPREKVIEFLDYEDPELVFLAILNLAGRSDSNIEELAEYAIHDNIRIRTAVFNNSNATDEIRVSAALLGVRDETSPR